MKKKQTIKLLFPLPKLSFYMMDSDALPSSIPCHPSTLKFNGCSDSLKSEGEKRGRGGEGGKRVEVVLLGAVKKIRRETERDRDGEHGASFPWCYYSNSSAGETVSCPSAVAEPRHRILTRPVRSGAN